MITSLIDLRRAIVTLTSNNRKQLKTIISLIKERKIYSNDKTQTVNRDSRLLRRQIVGAMVQAGATLEQALEACHKLGSAVGTIGFAASACQMPGAPKPLFTVPQGMLELGLGVHGEKGAATIKVRCLKTFAQSRYLV